MASETLYNGIPLPVMCPGGELQLNSKRANEARVELTNPGYSGPIENFTAEDCLPVPGDAQAATVRSKGRQKLDELKGRYVKIKVYGDNDVNPQTAGVMMIQFREHLIGRGALARSQPRSSKTGSYPV